MLRITLLRHATAQKNIERRHGGAGSTLHSSAAGELAQLLSTFHSMGIEPAKIHACPVTHAVETAERIGAHYGLPSISEPVIRPLFLGVLDGLSEEDARSRFPEIAERLEAWRRRDGDFSEVTIPDAESAMQFYERGEAFVGTLADDPVHHLVVVTRSVMTALVNALLGRPPVPGGHYSNVQVDPCAFATFEYESGRYHVNPAFTSSNLIVE